MSITKDDPAGIGRTLASSTTWRLRPEVEHIVIFAGEAPPWPAGDRLIIQQQSGAGIAAAFNQGAMLARGEWLWFLNGGDIIDSRLEPDFLLELLTLSRADVIVGGTTYEGHRDPVPHPPSSRRWPPLDPWIPHPSTLVRRNLFERYGWFDPGYTIVMDYEWWIRVMSDSVPVDVSSVPFAVFAPAGISQRPEFNGRRLSERDHAIRRHLWRIWHPWLKSTGRLLRASAQALLVWRPSRPDVS